jgi:transposase
MKVATIGLDIAKLVFELHGVDEHGITALRRRLQREQVVPFFANLPGCRVGLESVLTDPVSRTASERSSTSTFDRRGMRVRRKR